MATTMQPAPPSVDAPAPRLSSWVALLALAAGLLVSALHPFVAHEQVVEVAPFVDAIAARATELREGDIVLVHPPWRHDVVGAIDAVHALPGGVRATVALSLAHGQDPGRVLVVRDGGAPPLPRSRRELRDPRRHAPGLETGWLLRPGDFAVEDAENDLVQILSRAKVEVIEAGGRRVPCPWDEGAQRHRCDDLPTWMYVGRESMMIEGVPAWCAWTHPTSRGKVIVHFPDVALGRELRFSHALSDAVAGRAGGSSVEATVFVDDKQVLRAVRENASGWREARVSTPDVAGRADLRIEVTAQEDGARHYCWRLRSPLEESPR